MDKNLQPISDKAEGLLAQMQGFRRCSGVLRPILSDRDTYLAQLGRPRFCFLFNHIKLVNASMQTISVSWFTALPLHANCLSRRFTGALLFK